MGLISEFKGEDGYYRKDGCSYETAVDFIQCEILGHCGCGAPEESLEYIREIMRRIKNIIDSDYSESAWEYLDSFFHSEGEKYTMYYMLDKLGITDHGGSVPGWLSKKGVDLLEDLNNLVLED